MQQNPDYAKMFRGRPLRFVLPTLCQSGVSDVNENLINLASSKAEAYFLANGDVFVKPERLCNIGCETPRINYERYLGKKMNL